MRLRFASVALGLATLSVAAPLSAQLRASRPPRPTQNLPRLLVANPHTFQAADSAAAVRVGTGLRDKIDAVAEKWYQTVTRNIMNDALIQYGYPPDAVLPPLVARQLGTQLQARAMVVGSLNRAPDGKVSIEVRLLSRNDQTGFMTSMSQAAGQSFEDLGGKLAESLKGAFLAMQEAINCDQLATAEPAKAIEAANKALKAEPNHGLANLCLAQLAVTRKAPADEIIKYYQAAAAGDRLSVEALGGLLGQYQAKGDTAKIIDTYTSLIVVAPNNQKVVEEAIRFFIIAGKADLGEKVADEAIERDPANPDFFNLRATACLVQDNPEKNICALKAMEQVFALDTAKADTFNLQKTIYIAGRDSTNAPALLKWAQFANKKFPANAGFLGDLGRAYAITGPLDSLVAITKRLVDADKTDMTPVIRAVRALFKEKRYQDGLDLGVAIEQHGQETDKTNYGLILAQEAGLPILQAQPVDFVLATAIAKKAVSFLKEGSRGHQLASYVLGFGLLGQLQAEDAKVVEAKTCESVNLYETFINETKAALTAGQSIQAEVVAQRIQAIDSAYLPRVAQMKKAYCKGQ
jgi:tetratricopeptide (TPR) repeat protein